MTHDSMEFAKEQVARATLDHCVKCTICETHCPVSAVTPPSKMLFGVRSR